MGSLRDRITMQLKTKSLLAAAALMCIGPALAQSNDALKAAAQKAVSSNPEVTGRFNAYRASSDAIDASRGGFYPRLDLSANVGRDRDSIDSRTPESQSTTRSGAALTLTQLLWDGLGTSKDVSRLGHERLARYFEVVDVTELTALEAARAYYDVLRYRRLVALAEDNFVQHRSAFNQINSRVRAGVGRGVDLEQAGARLALAESNLSTEVSNLHDVSARYQRVVGEAPPAVMPLPVPLRQAIPASAGEAAAEAIRRSPTISASVESLRSARSLVSVRESAYQPKVEARVRAGAGRNFDGVQDQRRDSTAEIVLNWNLFNGGSDQARVRQQAKLLTQAEDQRDKVCRDVRQTVEIAYNDTRKLVDQLGYLDRNTIAIEKARDAYRQQFDIGQRSLLDLLNAENELYTARRSYANAEYDLGVAYVRTQASMNQLSAQLGLARDQGAPDAPDDASGWSADGDAPGRCPADAVSSPPIDFEALSKRAAAGTGPATPIAGGVSTLPATVAPAAAASSPLPRLTAWTAAWEAKDLPRYLSFYAPGFKPAQGSVDAWKARRQAMLAKDGSLSVKLENIDVQAIGPGVAQTRFKQTYTSAGYSDVVNKSVTWRLIDGQWFITKESNL
jgi:adhesin transport system outer membrane protein